MAQRYITYKSGEKTLENVSSPLTEHLEQGNHWMQSARAFLAVKETSYFLTEESPSG